MNAAVLWRAVRAYSLPASVVPVVLGTTLAARGYGAIGAGHFDLTSFIIVLLGAMLAHAGANVLNDYFDFVYRVDTRPEHGSGVLTGGEMKAKQALVYAVLLLTAAAICGALLLRGQARTVVPLALIGFGCAVFYSALLKKYGWGDLLIMIAFGVGLTLGAFGIQAGGLNAHRIAIVSIYSIPICLLVDAILDANNIRDTADDRAANVRTLSARLGPQRAMHWHRFLLFGPLAFVALGAVLRFVPLWALATFAATPLFLRAYRSGSVEGTAQTHLVFGLIYALSFLANPIFA